MTTQPWTIAFCYLPRAATACGERFGERQVRGENDVGSRQMQPCRRRWAISISASYTSADVLRCFLATYMTVRTSRSLPTAACSAS